MHPDPRIEAVQQDVLRMGALVEVALRKTLVALATRDFALADDVVRDDEQIDRMHTLVEDSSTRLIAERHPEGGDLRYVIAAIKVASALERIGDHARHVARRARAISDRLFADAMPLIDAMTTAGVSMLHDCLTAFAERDVRLAVATASRDDEIDELSARLYRLVLGTMETHPQSAEKAVDMMLVNRFLERLGDHVTNVCEWVVLAERAEHVELND